MIVTNFLPKIADHLTLNVDFGFNDNVIESRLLVDYDMPMYIRLLKSLTFNGIKIPLDVSNISSFFIKNFKISTQLRNDFYTNLYKKDSGLLVFKNLVTDIEGNLKVAYTINNNILYFFVSEKILAPNLSSEKRLIKEIVSLEVNGPILLKKYIISFSDDIKVVKKYTPKVVFNVKQFVVKSFELPTCKNEDIKNLSDVEDYIKYLKGSLEKEKSEITETTETTNIFSGYLAPEDPEEQLEESEAGDPEIYEVESEGGDPFSF